MRLHYFLLVATATLLTIIDAVSASTQAKLSAMTSTDSVSVARHLAGALSEDNIKRSLRTAKPIDEGDDGDDRNDDDDDDNDDDGEERGITVLSASTTAKKLRQWLMKNSIISKETFKHLKASGFSADEIAGIYAKYVTLG
ncbi:hypothetical protein PHYBOEH_000301 [Phytophthora boehmeriae]|uniref:RxLR effector protein n=1 Tax=Phytophthora boehmeriae TaxID=109152 RepID=A0A8T1VC09_9STRA|nr:hypothetical protein PHYBOEH_000301 [Phytophthora boehmeriae]